MRGPALFNRKWFCGGHEATKRHHLEAGSWKLEAGSWELGAGSWKLDAHAVIVERIRDTGPITVAEFMELALYHPDAGYYAAAPRRTGRSGDFYTSVDVGTLFGELLTVQLAEMWQRLEPSGAGRFQLVEAAAGDGRLARDVLDAAAAAHPAFYEHLDVILVERSPRARAAQRETLAPHAARVVASVAEVPRHITGAIVANELLDALPVHVVVQRDGALREIYVAERDGRLIEEEGPLSTPAIAGQLARAGASLAEGWRAEVGLEASAWVRQAGGAIERGFLLLFDYGHPAARLYSASHAGGTLMAYRRHVPDAQRWLDDPGDADLTTHVDLTTVELAAGDAGLAALGILDQTYFLLNLGLTDRLSDHSGVESVRRRLAARALMMPGGLGSTIKVMAFAKGLGRPPLRGLSSGRLT